MAYARWGEESDIYLFRDGEGRWQCVQCDLLTPPATEVLPSIEAVAEHLLRHIDAGHAVPDHCIHRVAAEVASWMISGASHTP
jgi:hypothetical protein